MSTPAAQHQAIEEIVVAIGVNVVYFEHDEYAHFDPVSLTAAVAALLLNGYFQGIVDAVRHAGKANATQLAARLSHLHRGDGPEPELPTVRAADAARYGDVAQSVLQTALVEQGFPLQKAAALAETVRRQADAVVTAGAGSGHD